MPKVRRMQKKRNLTRDSSSNLERLAPLVSAMYAIIHKILSSKKFSYLRHLNWSFFFWCLFYSSTCNLKLLTDWFSRWSGRIWVTWPPHNFCRFKFDKFILIVVAIICSAVGMVLFLVFFNENKCQEIEEMFTCRDWLMAICQVSVQCQCFWFENRLNSNWWCAGILSVVVCLVLWFGLSGCQCSWLKSIIKFNGWLA